MLATDVARAGARRLLAPMTIALAAGALTAADLAPDEALAAAGGAEPSRTLRPVDSLTIRVRAHVLAGREAAAEGAARGAPRGRTVFVQQRVGRRWRTVARDRTGAAGRWRAEWRAGRPGHHKVRAVLAGRRDVRSAARRIAVYRSGHASWYGPGFYGRRTACGQTLTTGTVGVAHKSLSCGTRVTFRYRGRSVTARVIDRGPYVAGREWDLTGATKRALGFGSTGTVWSTR